MKRPCPLAPALRASVQLWSAVRILPTCKRPVGEGAKRVVIMDWVVSLVDTKEEAPPKHKCSSGAHDFRLRHEEWRVYSPASTAPMAAFIASSERSEERRVGNECVSTCRYRWSQYKQTNKLLHTQ